MGKGSKTDIPETAQERELAKVMTEKYGLFMNEIRPMIDTYEARVRKSQPDYTKAQGMAAGTTMAAFDSARGNVSDTMRQRGAAPGSGAFQGSMGDVASKEGASMAGNETNAANDVSNMHYQGLENVLMLGSGQPAESQQGMTEAAGRASRNAIYDARYAAYENAGRAQAYGTAAGMGTRAYMGMETGGGNNAAADWNARDNTLNQGDYLTTPWT